MDLAQATNAPLRLEIGGKLRPVRAMTLADWGKLTAWIKSAIPSPLETAARAVQAAKDRGEPLAEWVSDLLVDRAMAQAQAWPPSLLSRRWLELLDEAEEGTARFLLVVLGACDPAFELAEAKSLALSIEWAEVASLIHLARHGELPPPKSPGSAAEAGTTTEPNPSGTSGDLSLPSS